MLRRGPCGGAGLAGALCWRPLLGVRALLWGVVRHAAGVVLLRRTRAALVSRLVPRGLVVVTGTLRTLTGMASLGIALVLRGSWGHARLHVRGGHPHRLLHGHLLHHVLLVGIARHLVPRRYVHGHLLGVLVHLLLHLHVLRVVRQSVVRRELLRGRKLHLHRVATVLHLDVQLRPGGHAQRLHLHYRLVHNRGVHLLQRHLRAAVLARGIPGLVHEGLGRLNIPIVVAQENKIKRLIFCT
jgi:hypothetical protein